MADPTLFGIGKSEWDLFHGFANWFSAVASVGAAVVALYIANRSARPTGRVSAGHRISIGQGSRPPYPEYAVLSFVNTGDRPIRVTQIGWTVGFFRKRSAVQFFDVALSSKLPIDLSHGQEAAWYVPLNVNPDPWPESFATKMLLPNYRASLWTLKVQAYSSVGYSFEAVPEEGLVRRLREACERHSSKS